MASLPIVDISPFRSDPTSADAQGCVQQLLAACHDIGFVYITGHSIDQRLDQALFHGAHEFFALPVAERQALAIANSAAFRGYTTLGDERTNGLADWREQLDVGPEEPAPADLTGPAWHRLRGPNQWPPSLPGMQPAVLDWMDEMEALGVTCLRALAVGLGQPIDRFDHAFLPESDVHLKVIRYPERAAPDAEQGLGAHHDTGVLTFIAQEGLGLQVETPDGFIDAPPMPGAYIMNLGEMLQRSTNGYLRATPHRVISRLAASASRSPSSSTLASKPCSNRSNYRPNLLPKPRRRPRQDRRRDPRALRREQSAHPPALTPRRRRPPLRLIAGTSP